jgi:hypothetical protein
MSKSKYDHLLIVRGGAQHLFEGRAVGGADLLLLAGVPEPVENVDPEYVDALVEAGVCIRVTAEGNYHGSHERHPTVIAAEKEAKALKVSAPTSETALETAGGAVHPQIAVPVEEAVPAPARLPETKPEG